MEKQSTSKETKILVRSRPTSSTRIQLTRGTTFRVSAVNNDNNCNRQTFTRTFWLNRTIHNSKKEQLALPPFIATTTKFLSSTKKHQRSPTIHNRSTSGASQAKMVSQSLMVQPPKGLNSNFFNQAKDNYLGKYELINELGQGSYGTVYLARRKTNPQECFAIKVYEKFKVNSEPSKFRNIRKQINVMSNLQHPNIVKLHEHTQTLTKINLVLQYCGSMSISNYVKKKYPLPHEETKFILKQTLEAILYLHNRNIVHRDIKAHNLLINRHKRVKLIDFGFSIVSTFLDNAANKDRKLSSICGTPNYMAPEVLKREDYVGEFADVWSIGILMYYLSEGTYPFKAQNIKDLTALVCRGKYTFKNTLVLPLKSMIQHCLQMNPMDRPSVKTLLLNSYFADDNQLMTVPVGVAHQSIVDPQNAQIGVLEANLMESGHHETMPMEPLESIPLDLVN